MKATTIEPRLQNSFQYWKKNMVRYGLKAKLGQFYTNEDETAILYEQGDFLFLAGRADMALLADYRDICEPDYRILISEEVSWQACLSSCPALSTFTRYAFKDEADFDDKVLKNIVEQLSKQLVIEAINSKTYQELAQEEWSQDLQGNFATFKDFQEAGAFGFVIRKGEEIVAGVSTALVYQKAIEIEIATKPAYQQQGLAAVLGAKMILESLQRSVFPLWDAHNEASKKIAEKLGYQCLGAYPAYELKLQIGETMTPEQLWNEYKTINPAIGDKIDAWAFGTLADQLADLVLRGEKTATASAYELYKLENKPVPQVGTFDVVLDSQDQAVCIIEITKVTVVPFKQVSAEHAFKEGEGDKSLNYWRQVHEEFFTEWMAEAGLSFSEETGVVLEEFRKVYPL